MRLIRIGIQVFLITSLLFVNFFLMPDTVSAQTLGDLKAQLKKYEENYANNKQEQQLTQEQLNQVNANIEKILKEIDQIHKDVTRLGEEIEALNADILLKDKEIKEIINFVQVSNGESAYLEYAFGAKNFTDFIYRMAVSEQLSSYNNQLIADFNRMIKENKEKTIELNNKSRELDNKQAQLKEERKKLGSKLSELMEIKVSIEDDIKSQKDAIKFYEEELGCKDNEDLNTCGRSKLPPETKFWRPVDRGVVSSNYGNRCYWLNGRYVCDFHEGIDMSNSGANNPVYAVGNGVVADTVQWDCGGRIVFINHNINGTTYTSVYMHLRKILVSKGDVVTKNTQIGVMGGNPNIEYWDQCSTGQHTHLTISYGLYQGWSSVRAGLVNPRNLVNFPGEDQWFSDRVTKY